MGLLIHVLLAFCYYSEIIEAVNLQRGKVYLES
jgi:hypothetical protein